MSKKIIKVLTYFYGTVFRQKPVYLVEMVLLIMITAIAPFVNMLLPKYVIDELLGTGNVKVLFTLVLAIILGNWICNTIHSLLETKLHKYHDYFEKYFEMALSGKCMEMDFEHTEDPEVLDLCEKAKNGMGWYSGGLQGLDHCFSLIVSYAITLCGVIIIIAGTSWMLLGIALIAVILGTFIVSRINRLDIAFFNSGTSMNRGFHYSFIGLTDPRYGRDIRLYDADTMMIEKGSVFMDGIYRMHQKTQMGTAKWNCVNALVNLLKNLGIYLYLGYLLVSKLVTVGSFTMLVNAANTFKDSLQELITQLQELAKKSNYMYEYVNFMEHEDAIEHNHIKVPEMKKPVIEFRNVSFHYPRSEVYVLKNINIVIHPGEHLAVVGLNGAGKTTFIKLLCRMYDVTEGEILVNGRNIKEYDYHEYWKLLSVVFQDFKLFQMSVEDNIRMGDWDKEKGVDINELCALCGLKEKMDSMEQGIGTQVGKGFDKTGFEPSGGEKQKIAMARALYKDAPIVILDEPTAALDPIAESEIYGKINELASKKTAIFISHRLSFCRICDKIAVFSDSSIKEYGTHDELMIVENGIYARMFSTQAQYYEPESC